MKSILANLKDPIVKNFVIKILTRGYSRYHISSKTTKQIIDGLERNYKSSSFAIKKVYNEVPELKNRKSIFWRGRKKYHLQKIRHFEIFRIIKNELKGKTFLELGCGENYLGWIITKRCFIKKYIGTDVYLHKDILRNEKLDFRKQKNAIDIPVRNESIDTLLIIDMIHHVDKNSQEKFLKEGFSKIKSGGLAIIIEYTFSNKNKSYYEKRFAIRFQNLSLKQKFMTMEIIDWIGNCLIRRRKINMPYAYRTMEQWNDLFKENNMCLIKSRYLGFLTKLFHPGPYSLFVLAKK